MTAARLRDRPSRRIDINGNALTVKVRESDRARTTRILLGPRRPLEIIVPAGTPDEEIDRALTSKSSWIADKHAQATAEAARPAQLGLDRPGVVWLAGEAIPVVASPHGRPIARLNDATLRVGGEPSAHRAAIDRWYRREARARIRAVAAEESARLRLPYRSLVVRDQKTRWGSCSNDRNLAFNWRLVIAPAPVLRYVVIHELCHLAVPSHSKAFWRQLDAAMADWSEPAAWLRDHGAELRAYIATDRWLA